MTTIRSVVTNITLRDNKVPIRHRFSLTDGRVIDGNFYRGPNSRLADDLDGVKGLYISVLDAHCTTTGAEAAYLALNLNHIISIEEL